MASLNEDHTLPESDGITLEKINPCDWRRGDERWQKMVAIFPI